MGDGYEVMGAQQQEFLTATTYNLSPITYDLN